MLLQGLYTFLATDGSAAAVQAALAQPPKSAIFETAAIKQPPRPFLVLNLVAGPPAGQTLDGISDLIDGEIQFDSYADTPDAARKLSQVVRNFLMKSFNGGTLPEGTRIQFVEVTMDHDEGYELGGIGYLYRSLLRLKAFYTEAA
jgi:hypothetical protein